MNQDLQESRLGMLRMKWDARYRDTDRRPQPPAILIECHHLLPPEGQALDLACGFGSGALLLAESGLEASAWDLSPVAVGLVREEAHRRALRIHAEVRDALSRPPEPESFNVILVSHFLERRLAPPIAAALRPGGLLFFQTFLREAVSDCGPSSTDYRLGNNELLKLFSGLLVRFYREEGRVGDLSRGVRDIAMLVAQRVD
jgi:SAM-dependent methyltransferase